MEGIIQWFSKNHVAANSLMVIIALLGLGTWFGQKTEIFPETSIDVVAVTVPFPNATPEEVEKGVIIPIEEAIQDLDGIDHLRSTAAPSQGVVTIEVKSGYDIRTLMSDVKTRIDAVQNLAEEAEEPSLEELVIKAQVMSIAVSAKTDEKTLRRLSERVRDGLLAYNDGPSKVTQASLAGVRDYEISIEVSESTLRDFGLTFDQVSAAVRASSLDLPSGSIQTTSGEVLIRTEQKRYTAREFETITVVTREDGSRVSLGDIAEIRDGFEEHSLESRFDNRPAMLINVYRVGDQDTLKIAQSVRDYVYKVAPKELPDRVRLEIWRDDSVFLDGRMKLLGRNAIFGLILVFIVLALFLRPSLALLVTIGIPVSFAGAIMVMPYTGVSINMISLFAFILVLGIVVDDAIVIGENVYSRIRKGEHPKLAAPRGTHEVGVVVIFGVLTTIVAFTPMLGLSGVSGKIWPNIPLIVIPTLLFSLVQSKLILPSHLSCLRPYDPDHKPGRIIRFQQVFSGGLERFVDRFYRPVLSACLRMRYPVLLGFVCIFALVITAIKTGWVGFVFFPKVEADIITAKVTMPIGVPFETTAAAVARLENAADELKEKYKDNSGNPIVRHMLASVGQQPFQISFNSVGGPPRASHVGEVTIELQSATNRKLTGSEVISIWRELTGPIPGAVELTYSADAAGGGNAIDLEITGTNLEALEAAAEEVKTALGEFDGVKDIASSNRAGNRELKLEILPSAEALDLRLEDVSRQTRQGFYGDEIQRLQRGRDEVRVFVRYPRDERASLTDLDNIKIRTKDGAEVPFSEVASATLGRSYATIQRSDRRRAIKITADLDKNTKTTANQVVESITRKDGLPGLFERIGILFGAEPAEKKPEGILTKLPPGVLYAFQGEQKDQRQTLGEMGMKALIALLAMYVLMAIPLRSYVQPLIVMSVIPFGLVGAVFGHIIMGYDMSIMSMCGIVALAGVVVNDSLVLVDYVNRKRAQGNDIIKAATEAGAARFRPILLTSLTTFAGLTPMLLETDIQGKFLVPMAVSLAFGIIFATTITLILIPLVYLVLHDIIGHHRAPGHVHETAKSETD
ncbi:MAG: multidrug efflux pump subunit AcrB [Verrucomicrobiales bacterium]|jgi:multidrug efflux pump subunit AcrB